MACAKCGGEGHIRGDDGEWKRCSCLEKTLRKGILGVFDGPIAKETPLEKYGDVSVLLDAPLATLRPHVAKILLKNHEANRQTTVMDVYRILEIFLEKDAEYTAPTQLENAELLILLLGFGDPRNKYLPELILQVMRRRELIRKPTWVILGVAQAALAGRYGTELAEYLGKLKALTVKK